MGDPSLSKFDHALTCAVLRGGLCDCTYGSNSRISLGPEIQTEEAPNITPEYFMQRGMQLLVSKRLDYTTGSRYENFNRSAELASWFKADRDKAFVVLIGTKLARLASLLDRKTPNHESINDTFTDLINYCALWAAHRVGDR